jgi:hypothetical protein
MAKSFDSLVKQTTTKKTQAKAVRRTQELLGEMTGTSQKDAAAMRGRNRSSIPKPVKRRGA